MEELGRPRWPHKPEIAGSNPAPATNRIRRGPINRTGRYSTANAEVGSGKLIDAGE